MSPIQRMEQLSPFYSQNLNQQLQNVKQFNERLGQAPAKFTEQPASRVQDQAALLAKPGLLQTVSDVTHRIAAHQMLFTFTRLALCLSQ